MTLTVGSVCSGIGAPEHAWSQLSWRFAWQSEVAAFPSAVLAARFPGVPNLGDMAGIAPRVLSGEVEAPDVLVGGTPCQAFSIAGARKSLEDARGNLSLEFVRLADAIDAARVVKGKPPCVVVWENVPGVLSVRDNAFGCFVAGLAGEVEPFDPPRRKWTGAGVAAGPARAVAWRTLDAQYFGVAQRRRRVFVVASAGGGACPASILFEREGARGDHPQGRRQGRGVAPGVAGGPGLTRAADAAPLSFAWQQGGSLNLKVDRDICGTLVKNQVPAVVWGGTVRRITPKEAGRLQGFPDDWARIAWRGRPAEECPDAPQWQAYGNSMCVNVMAWIGGRLANASRS